jgi:hypothetical protein
MIQPKPKKGSPETPHKIHQLLPLTELEIFSSPFQSYIGLISTLFVSLDLDTDPLFQSHIGLISTQRVHETKNRHNDFNPTLV